MVSFALGVIWSLKIKNKDHSVRGRLVLGFEKTTLSPKVIELFVKQQRILVEQKVADNKDALQKIAANDFDVLVFFSANEGALNTSFSEVKAKWTENISHDFMSLLPMLKTAGPLPIGWRTEEIGKDEQIRLTLILAGINKESRASEQAEEFLKFLATPEAQILNAESEGQASTVSAVDSSNLAEELKPSYLRKIPLKRIQLAL